MQENNSPKTQAAVKKNEIYVSVKRKKSTIEYEKDLKNLQIELLKFQNHVKAKGLKVLILIEGRDAAGKGGAIKRVIFDRSWYNRAGVEPVMGFCTPQQHKDFLREVPLFENMISNSDIIFFKFYFSVSKDEQKKRFEKRRSDPLKQYKLSPVDQKSQELWDKYTLAKYSMLLASNTPTCPWTIISSDDKKKARLNLLRFILSKVEYPNKKTGDFSKIDAKLVRSGEEEIRKMEANLEKLDSKKADEKIKDLD
ncbi:polyphosphate kinase 2 [Campylobacter jejuni]|uniref:polyphosphate kinase n=1 Tax=Campylobacter jejuni TaxID=197 RepID=UPI00076407E1|nr:polyphosphate kinase [Campylobacter jejuni]EDO8687035.1 polyphosphate kinase 2 [Campylobacter jejuni]HED1176085.1 polyphosphate kinase 2 [Campylobacter jejuni]